MTSSAPDPGGAELGLRERFSRAQAGDEPLAFLLIAIDRLERVSDEGLRELLRTSVDGLVLSDPESSAWICSRWGDRTLVLCPGLGLPEVPAVARRLIEGARKLRIKRGETRVRVAVSVGVAHTRGRPQLPFEVFLGVAEESLGVAQGAGGNRWVHTELYGMLERRVKGGGGGDGAPPVFPLSAIAGASAPVVLTPAPRSQAAPPPPRAPSLLAPTVAQGAVVRVSVPAGPIGTSSAEPPGAEEEADPSPSDVDILQRRLRKLMHALELAETEIRRLREEQGAERGIASIYRTVQGLSPDDNFVDVKRKLMLDIFEANQQLQKISAN